MQDKDESDSCIDLNLDPLLLKSNDKKETTTLKPQDKKEHTDLNIRHLPRSTAYMRLLCLCAAIDCSGKKLQLK